MNDMITPDKLITVSNKGPILVESNFWTSEIAARGNFLMAPNAGEFRLLVPRSKEETLLEMETAKEVVITRGAASQRLGITVGFGSREATEILFDDHTSDPFCLFLGLESWFPRISFEGIIGEERKISIWTAQNGRPHCALTRPCYCRVAPLPCLKPWSQS